MMKTRDTYFIKRGNKYIWSGTEFELLTTDEVLEVRLMIFADDGKVLVKDDEIIGQALWLRDGDTKDNYVEVQPNEYENAEIEIDEENIEM